MFLQRHQLVTKWSKIKKGNCSFIVLQLRLGSLRFVYLLPYLSLSCSTRYKIELNNLSSEAGSSFPYVCN
jgi:hypothetical protein